MVALLAGLVFPRAAPREQLVVATGELKILVAMSGSDPTREGSLTVAVQNNGAESLRLSGVGVANRDGTPMPLSWPEAHFSSQRIAPGDWANVLLDVPPHASVDGSMVRVDVESKEGRRYAMGGLANACVWSPVAYESDRDNFVMYARVPSGLASVAGCRLNGRDAKCVVGPAIDLVDGGRLVSVEIDPQQTIRPGERVVAEVSFDGGAKHVGTTKAFSTFVCGKTGYQIVLRAVRVEHADDGITLNLYNEADYRKAPLRIEGVRVDGIDMTHLCRLPLDPLPPDAHRYEKDLRPLFIPNAAIDEKKIRRRVDILYKRLPPLQQGPIPEEYWETLKSTFFVQRDILFPIEHESGVGVGRGVCLFFGGLRPKSSMEDGLNASRGVREADASIPLFVCTPSGASRSELHAYARRCDFVVVSQPTWQGSDQVVARTLEGLNLRTPWAAQFNFTESTPTERNDVERLAWSTIGSGGRGVLLGVGDGGESVLVASRRSTISKVLNSIGRLRPLLEKGIPLPLESECNQNGVRVHFLACGTEELLMIAVNEWCSRAERYRGLPNCFATRLGVKVRIKLGPDWITRHAEDPLRGEMVRLTLDGEGVLELNLPPFDAVQVVRLTRNKSAANTPATIVSDSAAPLIVCEESPIVSLGTVRPESTHRVRVPIRSLVNEPMELTLRRIDGDAGELGKCIASSVRLPENGKGALTIDYTAPSSHGESITTLQFVSLAGKIATPIHICADVRNPANLSPAQVDFGEVAMGRVPEPRQIALESRDNTAKIADVISSSNWIQGAKIAADGRSFKFKLAATRELGWQNAEITVKIAPNDGAEMFEDVVRVRVQTMPTVFATPEKLVLTSPGGPRRFRLRVRQIDEEAIRITKLFHHKGITTKRPHAEFAATQEVDVELDAETIRDDLGVIQIYGDCKSGESFCVEVPISVVGLTRDPRPSTIEQAKDGG
jgi:hypothetical protein